MHEKSKESPDGDSSTKSKPRARFSMDTKIVSPIEKDKDATEVLLIDRSHIPNDRDQSAVEPLLTGAEKPSRFGKSSPTFHRRGSEFDMPRKSSYGRHFEEVKLLIELYELQATKRKGNQWTETARWIKYEERVEGVDKFWSKPRVAFLAFHSLTQLKLCFQRGLVLLNAEAPSYDDLLELIVIEMAKQYQIEPNRIQFLSNAICGHREGKLTPANSKSAVGFVANKMSSFAKQTTTLKPDSPRIKTRRASDAQAVALETKPDVDIAKPGDRKLVRMQTVSSITRPENRRLTRKMTKFFAQNELTKQSAEDEEFLKRLPQSAQGAKVLSGAAKDLAHVRFAMIRLADAKSFPEYHQGRVPLKFLFVLVGPPSADIDYHEVGRSLCTLMANPSFQMSAMAAIERKDLVDAIDTFLDEGIVVPPVDIDKGVMNNVDEIKKALRRRSKGQPSADTALEAAELPKGITIDAELANEEEKGENPLERSGKLFGGLIRDVRKRAPYYWSDFKDAANFQCLTSVCFMFFAALAPAITFGGLLEKNTKGWMGTIEVLVAQSLCGIIWSLFSAQPLLIMAATGPFLIFEGSLYEFCKSQGLDFMTFRVWAGVWVLIAAFITVMLEGSFLIRYFTRFTEDIFASLVALIFIVESLKFVVKAFGYHPVLNLSQYCGSYFHAMAVHSTANLTSTATILNESWPDYKNAASTIIHPQTHAKHGQPDTALLSAVLVIGTFYLSYQFRQLRTTIFLGRPLRRLVSDFGVPIAIFIVVLIDFTLFTEPYVQHLKMSDTFSPTSPEKRGWFIHPFGDEKHPFPIWAYFAALVPALLVYILIFVECELTQLLLLRPERKLKKGGGFHWDLLLLGALTLMCSLMGLPWMCAAVLQSLAHGTSLTILKNRAPGQPPQVDRVVEQRVTTLLISLLTGGCAFLGFVLKEVPIAVLFGVFLFLGVMTLAAVDMTNRLVLLFVPQKYFPDRPYCRSNVVSMWRMHLYTIIQLVCLGLMWLCKSISQISLAFPFMLMIIALFRIYVLPRIYSHEELEALDGEEELEDEDGEIDIFRGGLMGV